MAPSDRFKPIQKIAENKERKAAAALGESLKKKEAAEKQLQDLKQYHADYLERFSAATRNGINGARLHEFQAFISKLELAISEQEKAVVLATQSCTRSKQQWTGTYTKKRAMGNAVDRMKAAELHERERNEQKLVDDRGVKKSL